MQIFFVYYKTKTLVEEMMNNDKLVIEVRSQNELTGAAKKLLYFALEEKILLFNGNMGAGKTTFIKFICKELGVTDLVSSPTFSIVNEYASTTGPIYHFDFYRLKSETEALDIGLEDYLCSGNYCLIEWPEKIEDLLPPRYIKAELEEVGEQERRITCSKIVN